MRQNGCQPWAILHESCGLCSQTSALVSLEPVFPHTQSMDAEFLLAHVTRLSRGELLAKVHQGLELTEVAQLTELDALVTRREAREPLQHLLGSGRVHVVRGAGGSWSFRAPARNRVSWQSEQSRVRPRWLVGERGLQIVDLCSGSGVLAIASGESDPARHRSWR
jgi:release factor glutamine methyltransferase